MSFELLYKEMKKTVWDKKSKDFVQKEFDAYCNSRVCTKPQRMKKGRYDSRYYNSYRFVKKDVVSGCINCPDCECALLWKEKIELPRAIMT